MGNFTYTPSRRLNLVNEAGIEYGLLVEGASGGGDHGSSQAQESYLVRYADLRRFLLAIFTTPRVFGASVGGASATITIMVPQAHPNFPNLYAVSYSYKTVKQVDGTAPDTSPWTYGIATIGYQSLPYSVSGDTPFLSRRVEGTGSIITLPRTFYHFDSTPGLRIDQAVGQLIPNKQISITKHRLPVVDEVTLDSLLGTVNAGPFLDINGSVYDPGTVLFQDYTSDWQYNWDGAITWNLTYNLVWRPISWNKFMNPSIFDWDDVLDPAGDPIYSSSDLSVLFS